MPGRSADDERFSTLLRNEWELHDARRMRRVKVAAISLLLPLLWALVYLSIYAVAAPVFSAGLTEAAGVATAITLGLLLLIIVKLRQMDREKANWHFAALHDPRLEHEATLAVAREILTRRGYAWEERTRRTRTLFITYLDVKAHAISMRVWFSTLMTPPVVEIGFGPEDAVNRERLRDLRSATTEAFVRRYGTAT